MKDHNSIEISGEVARYSYPGHDRHGKKVFYFNVINRTGPKVVQLKIRTTGRVADVCADVLCAGDNVTVRGLIAQDLPINPDSGKKEQKVYVLAKEVEREEVTT